MSPGKAASAFRKYSRRPWFPGTVPEVSPRSLTTRGDWNSHPPCSERGRPQDHVGSKLESSPARRLRFVGRPLFLLLDNKWFGHGGNQNESGDSRAIT